MIDDDPLDDPFPDNGGIDPATGTHMTIDALEETA